MAATGRADAQASVPAVRPTLVASPGGDGREATTNNLCPFAIGGTIAFNSRGQLLTTRIAGAGAGGVPVVSVFSGRTGGTLASWFAYAQVLSGGGRVAAGDVTGDGPLVRVFNGQTQALLASFFTFDPSHRNGVYVGGADRRVG